MSKYALEIKITTSFIGESEESSETRYAFAYKVVIKNIGELAVQVISRHWTITQENGQVEDVKGLGLVGAQPLILPGKIHEYTSGCLLRVPYGSMKGSFFCVAEDAHRFDVDIPEFILKIPRVLH